MTISLLISIATALGMLIAVGIGFGVYKQTIRDNRLRICELDTKTDQQETRIQKLENQYWSEEKLFEMIQRAVEQGMLKMENKWLKDGFLHKHTRKSD